MSHGGVKTIERKRRGKKEESVTRKSTRKEISEGMKMSVDSKWSEGRKTWSTKRARDRSKTK